MEAALNIATTLFIFTFFVGVVLLVVMGFNLSRWRKPLPQPKIERLPTRAADEVRTVLERLKGHYYRTNTDSRSALGHEIHRLEVRLTQVQHRTHEDQYVYYQLARRMEKAWQDWQDTHSHLAGLARQERAQALLLLDETEKKLQSMALELKQEWHRAVALDDVLLSELQNQGVLELVIPPPEFTPPAAPQPTPPPPTPKPTPTVPTASVTASVAAPPEAALPQQAPAPQMPTPAPTAETLAAPPPPAAPAEAPPHPSLMDDAVMHGAAEFQIHTYGETCQTDFLLGDLPKAGMAYMDATFNLSFCPQGVWQDGNVSGCDFNGVVFEGIHRYQRCVFKGADLGGVVLALAEAAHGFEDCDLSDVSWRGAVLEKVAFVRCNLAGSHWGGAQLRQVRFIDCDLSEIHWEQADLSQVVVTEQTLGALPPETPPRPNEP